MKKLFGLPVLVYCLVLFTAAATASAGDYLNPAAAPAPEASVSQQGQGLSGGSLLPPIPIPLPDNPIYYWHDSRGSVLGISRRGQIVWLEIPSGYVHLGAWDILSGFALDTTLGVTNDVRWDLYDYRSGDFAGVSFLANIPGNTTYPGTLLTLPLRVTAVVRTTDNAFRLTNLIKWRPRTRMVSLKMTWKNISGLTYDLFAPKVFYDIDANNDVSDTESNHFARISSNSAVGWNDPADTLYIPGSPVYALTVTSGFAITPWEIYLYPSSVCYDTWGYHSGIIPGSGTAITGDGEACIYYYVDTDQDIAPNEVRRYLNIFQVK